MTQPQPEPETENTRINPDIPIDAVRQFMTLKLQKPLQQIFTQPITITQEADHPAAISIESRGKPIITIAREDHRIEIREQNPGKRKLDPNNLIIAHDDRPMQQLQTQIAETIEQATIGKAEALVQEQWQKQAKPNARLPHPETIRLAVRDYVRTLPPSMQFQYRPDLTIRQIHDSILQLIHPEIVELARTFSQSPSENVSLAAYNFSAENRPLILELTESNPGAIAWYLLLCQPEPGQLNHPGQVITAARTSMTKAELSPHAWKTAAKLDLKTMLQLIRSLYRPTLTAEALNAIHHAGYSPPWELIHQLLTPTEAFTREETGAGSRICRQNFRQYLTLLLKYLKKQPDAGPAQHLPNPIRNRMHDNADYINHLTGRNQPLQSKTWQGLCKTADRWHQEHRRMLAQQEWEKELARKQGRILSWESALEEMQLMDHTVTPLTDEKMLFMESKEMSHCVHIYGERCASGDTRIFHIASPVDEHSVATLEIRRNYQSNTWQTQQLRSRHNHPVTTRIEELSSMVAALYQEAWAAEANPDKEENPTDDQRSDAGGDYR